MAKLAIKCGLPRSGKTTRAKSLQREGWVRVCPDDSLAGSQTVVFVAAEQ
jgi:tRNA uridine 5-carbamoylmethylation protein Kti12